MSTPSDPLPPDVLNALERGNKIEAIKLLRQKTGLGLKESKDLIDAAAPQVVKTKRTLAPGEEPASGGRLWWWVALVAAGVAVYYAVRGGS